MNRFIKAYIYSFIALAFSACNVEETQKPNIVLILVDDMGYADLGCYGNPIIETPNLDKLAANGIRFSQFYNTARCSPTRASLLTGLYAHQTGLGYLEAMNKDESHPGYRGFLNKNCVTIAEALKPAGYFTAISGKWHVGGSHGVHPWDRGFDRSLTATNPQFYYPEKAKTLYLNGEHIDPQADVFPKDWYASDLYADFGLRFIDEAIAEEKPFFLYLAFTAPHFPLQAPKETIDKYKGKFDKGWDEMRKPIYDKQLAMGLIDEKWPISPKNRDVPDWDKLTPEVKERMAHIQEIYAACVDRMDVAVGSLVEGLKTRGELENTIIVFMSDNGACAEYGPYGRYDGPEKSGTANSFVYQGQSWATYSNTPFRRYKHFTTEGGISTPCIVHWPKGLAENMKGSIVHQYGHIIDIMPTFLEIAEATYPVSHNQNEIKPMEGLSILPVLKGEDFAREAPIYWEHEGNRGGRSGKWKIVSFNYKPWTLYDLENDRTEQLDLAKKHPEILEKLSTGWDAWAKRCNVEPWPEKRNSCGEPFKWAAEKYQIK